MCRCQQLSQSDYKEDIIIVAGDLTDDLGIITKTLQILTSKFQTVFFLPGNHELWVRRQERDLYDSLGEKMQLKQGMINPEQSTQNANFTLIRRLWHWAKSQALIRWNVPLTTNGWGSLHLKDPARKYQPIFRSHVCPGKLEAIQTVCSDIGVQMKPQRIGEVWIVPLLSYYHSSFDREPEVAGARRVEQVSLWNSVWNVFDTDPYLQCYDDSSLWLSDQAGNNLWDSSHMMGYVCWLT